MWIGLILLACTIIYAIPRTGILGAVLLTDHLGGTIATQLRLGENAWLLFRFGIGVLVWVGLYLQDNRVSALVPLEKGWQRPVGTDGLVAWAHPGRRTTLKTRSRSL